mmetsp:Transcript_1407/g.3040  ORF Transcript_1407/g.3040 Transcript_1407/m.3040 type:complete len:287 (+) Transcript_1407:134-994(+)
MRHVPASEEQHAAAERLYLLLRLLIVLAWQLKALTFGLFNLERVRLAFEHSQLPTVFSRPRLVRVVDGSNLPPVVEIVVAAVHVLLVVALVGVARNLERGGGLKVQAALLVELERDGYHLLAQCHETGLLFPVKAIKVQPVDAVSPVTCHLLLLHLHQLPIVIEQLKFAINVCHAAVIHPAILEPIPSLHETPDRVWQDAVQVTAEVSLRCSQQASVVATRSVDARVVGVDDLEDVAYHALLDNVSDHLAFGCRVHSHAVVDALVLDSAEDLGHLLHDRAHHIPQS